MRKGTAAVVAFDGRPLMEDEVDGRALEPEKLAVKAGDANACVC
ncbi:MAG: hypothetical protein AAF414_07235 [Pseudomonadota bacterium]